MLKHGLYLLITLTTVLLGGCAPEPQSHQHSTLQFGTLIDITLYGATDEQAQQAFEKLDQDLAYLHIAWSPWETGSLRRTNGLIATGKSFSAGPSVLPLIEKSQQLAEQTDHLFNPAIGQLINLWQFHRHDEDDIQPPDASAIQTLIDANPRMSDLKQDGIRMRSNNPSVLLNFGAFAKGHAIDLEMQQLKRLGIENAIINTGGDLKVIGKPGNRPWHIAIQHPRKDTWLATIQASAEESIFTSGDYERYYMYEGKRYHHILDPRTGYPAMGSQSVTVIHQDAGLADAAATALFIAGPQQWLSMAKRLEITQAMLVDAEGNIHITPELRKRIRFNPKIQATIIVTPAL